MKRSAFFFLLAFCLLCVGEQAFAQKNADDITGLWSPSSGKARVNIYLAKNGKYYGKIVWLREPNDPKTGEPKLDKNNSDEAKRKEPLMGYLLLKAFEFKGNGSYENGTIYDPESGSTYNCVISMPDKNTLEVRGYVGVSLFGRTDTWTRLKTK